MKPFGVEFMSYDPFVGDNELEKYGVRRAHTVDELFSKADYISVHTPYMAETHHIIGERQFNLMKDDCIMVVTGRGGVVDEYALKKAIEGGKPKIVGVDVIEDEVNFKSVLRNMEQVVMTPHEAYYSEEANEDLRRKTIGTLVEVIREKKVPTHVINKDVIGKSRMELEK